MYLALKSAYEYLRVVIRTTICLLGVNKAQSCPFKASATVTRAHFFFQIVVYIPAINHDLLFLSDIGGRDIPTLEHI